MKNIIEILELIFWDIVFLIFVFPWIWIPLAIYDETWEGPKWARYIAYHAFGENVEWKNL